MARIKLGEICEIVSGSTPKTSVEEYWNGDIDWITQAELKDETYIIEESQRKITQIAVQNTGLKPFPKETVILSSRAPIAGKEMRPIPSYIKNKKFLSEKESHHFSQGSGKSLIMGSTDCLLYYARSKKLLHKWLTKIH